MQFFELLQVTSGYNSDTVSEHEYENIRVQGQGSCYVEPPNSDQNTNYYDNNHITDTKGDDDEDNYVILRPVSDDSSNNNLVRTLRIFLLKLAIRRKFFNFSIVRL